MTTLVQNLIFLGILIFAAGLIIWGLLGSSGFLGVLRGKATVGVALMAVGGAILGAAAVIWAANDFTGDRILITTVGNWIEQILTEPIGGQ